MPTGSALEKVIKAMEPQKSDSCTEVFCSDLFIFSKCRIQEMASFSQGAVFIDNTKRVTMH